MVTDRGSGNPLGVAAQVIFIACTPYITCATSIFVNELCDAQGTY